MILPKYILDFSSKNWKRKKTFEYQILLTLSNSMPFKSKNVLGIIIPRTENYQQIHAHHANYDDVSVINKPIKVFV